MAFGDDAQNTWDKQQNQEKFHEQLGHKSENEAPMKEQLPEDLATGTAAPDAPAMPAEPDRGFHERLDEQSMAIDDLGADDLADAELDSDLDYDTSLGEANDGAMDRDSAA